MPQIVHVVAPSGERYERIFGDAATPAQILGALRHPDAARLFGRSAAVVKADAVFGEVVPHPDHESPWVIDHPGTRIVVGVADGPGGEFRETKCLAGPPAAKGGGDEAAPPVVPPAPVPPPA